MKYAESIDFIMSQLPMFQRSGAAAYKADLRRTENLMCHLNNPERKFKSIHIAGTNGKGSISNMLSAIFQSAGYKTGLFTSPHLIDFRERIRINGEMISKKAVASFIEKNLQYIKNEQLSFFEMTAGLAFDYFAKQEVDIAIIETGMGGRLDSTNVIEPELSIISNIGFDHTAFLGDTLAKIAYEKAGIIKNRIPVLIGEKQSETTSVFTEKVQSVNSKLYFAEDMCHLTPILQTYLPPNFTLKAKTSDTEYNITTRLSGDYQAKNIKTVIAACQILNKAGFPLKKNQIQKGLKNTEKLTGFVGRWTYRRTNTPIIFDTAHNYEGLKYISEMLKKVKYEKLHIVLGMVDDKDHVKLIHLMPENAEYYFCKADIPRGFDAQKLMLIAKAQGREGQNYGTVKNALKNAMKNAKPKDLVFVGGSTFTVAEGLAIMR